MTSPLPHQRCPACRVGQPLADLFAFGRGGRRHRWNCAGCSTPLRLNFRVGDLVFWPLIAAFVAWEYFDYPFDPSQTLFATSVISLIVISGLLASVAVAPAPPADATTPSNPTEREML